MFKIPISFLILVICVISFLASLAVGLLFLLIFVKNKIQVSLIFPIYLLISVQLVFALIFIIYLLLIAVSLHSSPFSLPLFLPLKLGQGGHLWEDHFSGTLLGYTGKKPKA